MIANKDALNEIVKDELRRYISKNVSLQSFCTELNKPHLRSAIIDHLNKRLESAGRRVERISFESSAFFEPRDDFKEFKQDVVCEIHEYPKPVIIKNTVQMILRDVAKYKSIGSPPLEGWVKEKLERIIREELFKKRYLDILFGFQTRNGADSSELIQRCR